jgi:hypothetical protein
VRPLELGLPAGQRREARHTQQIRHDAVRQAPPARDGISLVIIMMSMISTVVFIMFIIMVLLNWHLAIKLDNAAAAAAVARGTHMQ